MSAPEILPSAGPVELRFTALPEHVRTARLIATAVARRTGLDENALEGVRLAVGEACGRAVQRTESSGTAATVEVDLLVRAPSAAGSGALEIEVRDSATAQDADGDDVGLLLMEGLADSVELADGPGGPGGVLRLCWNL